MNTYVTNPYEQSDERIGLGGIGSGLGFFPGLGFGRPGFGRPGFGRPGFGRPGFGFGLPFLTGLAAGAILTPRPIPRPFYPAPYPIYNPYQYPYYY